MENNSSETLGSKGLINKHEFIRIILQSLYSLGYTKTASLLESESGVSYKSNEFQLLESHVLNGNWEACVTFLNSITEILGESVESALFLVFRQTVMEYLKRGEDGLALDVLRKRVSALRVDRFKVHSLANSVVNLNDEVVEGDLRGKLLMDLEKLLPPPISIPDGRLEHLVETTVTAWVDSCLYHSSLNPVSLYEDHSCGRDHFPTTTTQILTGHKNEVWFVQFSNSGDYLASSSNDCTAIIWKVQEDGKLTLKHTLSGHQRAVSFVAWSPDDTKLLTCGNIEVLKLWDVETGTCKHTFGNDGFVVSSCAWFPNSTQFVCGSFDPEKGICMWDCDGNELRAWRGMRMPKVVDLTVTPDGEYLISIFLDKEIRILHLATNAERVISEEHPITSISVSADGKFFIVNLNSQEIHMWDVAGTWKNPLRYTGHKQCKYVIRSCFGGSDSTFIASGSENSEVYIWNSRSSKPIEVLSGHSLTVNCVSWNPKRPQMLASASDDHTIRIWGPSL
ncbi:putative transcription factor WD40-like family [Medicago truncatula]|uniref:Putative transcription factor WD40-like family n=1 Tax=Medicago truncatula TaxID=3880 RepID=A0A072VM11_MEDTR|nr:WD repeat-containing protein WDS homolog [Medicago truncatula]KEH42443.1 transducin/WD40 repeat protein [Medicago truncatula]RHN79960.1 putative transcription factor WD40-like family [Medicago truncatula]